MSFSKAGKAKKGGTWKKSIRVWEQKQDKTGAWKWIKDPITISEEESLTRISFQLSEIKILQLQYYGSKMPKEQAKTEKVACGAGILSVAAIGLHCIGAHSVAVAAWKRALMNVGLVASGTVAVGGATVALTADKLVFHGYLVIECSGGIWLSVEKDDTGIHVRIGTDDTVINFKEYNVPRINPSFLCWQTAKSGCSVQDLFVWIIERQLPLPYHVLESNCKHFCFDLADRFGDGQNSLPNYWALLVKDSIGKEKSA